MSLCTAAYQAEILRGGLQSSAEGTGRCGGDVRHGSGRHLPADPAAHRRQRTLPALTSEAIMILKASSLVSVVGVSS